MNRVPQAMNEVLAHEGFWSDDPDDSGGKTFRGVTFRDWSWLRMWVLLEKCMKYGKPDLSLLTDEEAGQVNADSAGTHSYHLGSIPDARAISAAARFGVDISGLRARKIEAADFARFDRIIAMDHHNLMTLEQLAPAPAHAKISLMMKYASEPGPEEVPDPYYGSRQDFSYMCRLLNDATCELVRSLEPLPEERL